MFINYIFYKIKMIDIDYCNLNVIEVYLRIDVKMLNLIIYMYYFY